MPTIFVKLPRDTFKKDQLQALGAAITEAAHKAEGIPDDPKHHILTSVVIEEISPELFFVAGQAVVPHRIPVIVVVHPPQGVLDADRWGILAKEVNSAVRRLAGELADRLTVSCIPIDVPEGSWGGNGEIWTLEKISAVAGYTHKPQL